MTCIFPSSFQDRGARNLSGALKNIIYVRFQKTGKKRTRPLSQEPMVPKGLDCARSYARKRTSPPLRHNLHGLGIRVSRGSCSQ